MDEFENKSKQELAEEIRHLLEKVSILKGTCAHAYDISKRALIVSEELINYYYDNIPAYVYIKDSQSNYFFVNKSCERLFAMNREDLSKREYNDFDFFDVKMAERLREKDRFVLDTGESIEFEEVGQLLMAKGAEERHYLLLAFPLKDVEGNTVGVCGFSHDITRFKQVEKELQLMNKKLRLSQEELEKKNEELCRLSLTDSLTGLLNRRAIEPLAERAMARSRRSGYSVSLLIFDIDYFKQFNDQYGHVAGDRVLAAAAKEVGNSIRITDSIVRWGGEEFVVLATDTDLVQAVQLANKIRQVVAAISFEDMGGITVSVGLAQYNGKGDFRQWLKCADRALYQAKGRGRNCTVAYSDPLLGGG
ncbi:sensor domain-containing diguanylate cyclase [Desulfotalea psychrophila]|nr:GGDEF domain-containing protein [Desulfotalea psychrophila]